MRSNRRATQRLKGRVLAVAAVLVYLLAGVGVLVLPAARGATAEPAAQVDTGDPAASPGIWRMERWSPYAVGVLIGMLSWAAFLMSDKPLGVSTAYARSAGMLEEKIRGPAVRDQAYYQEYVPKVDWEWMLALGLFGGAFLSAALSGAFAVQALPPLWTETFGGTITVRWAVALVGGFLLGLGARWADGCTSGHGISGTLQLVLSSWVALLCFFGGGVLTASLLYRLGS
jgi:uncharacterized membrane protein YedE/YeeE